MLLPLCKQLLSLRRAGLRLRGITTKFSLLMLNFKLKTRLREGRKSRERLKKRKTKEDLLWIKQLIMWGQLLNLFLLNRKSTLGMVRSMKLLSLLISMLWMNTLRGSIWRLGTPLFILPERLIEKSGTSRERLIVLLLILLDIIWLLSIEVGLPNLKNKLWITLRKL